MASNKVIRVASDTSLLSTAEIKDLFPSSELHYENANGEKNPTALESSTEIAATAVNSEKKTEAVEKDKLLRSDNSIKREEVVAGGRDSKLPNDSMGNTKTSYGTQLLKWEQKSWHLFAKDLNWILFITLSAASLLISNISLDFNISNALAPGFFFATIRYIRSEEKNGELEIYCKDSNSFGRSYLLILYVECMTTTRLDFTLWLCYPS